MERDDRTIGVNLICKQHEYEVEMVRLFLEDYTPKIEKILYEKDCHNHKGEKLMV